MSLDLDERQRAMLQEMGLRLWAPGPAVADLPDHGAAPLPAAAAPQAVVRPVAVAAATLAPGVSPQPVLAPPPPQNPPVTASLEVTPASDLARAIAECRACRLCQGRRAPVFDAAGAARQADWMVVGDPPEAADEQAGQPLAGPAGQLLDNMLRALGLAPQQEAAGQEVSRRAYVSAVVKCRAADGVPPEAAELAACHGFLQREISQVRPRVILALGLPAALSLLQESLPGVQELPLGKLRGRIHRAQGIPLVVSYPLAYLMRNQADKARAWADLCLARSALLTMPE